MRTLLPILFLVLASGATQAAEAAKPQGTLIELSAEASRTAPNDLARASAFSEASDANPRDLAKKVNGVIAQALAGARAYPTVKVQSAGTHTWPNYDKAGRITGWRMRSNLQLESRDITALTELLGQLQGSMGVGQVAFMPSPETHHKVEDAVIVDALAAFEARAKLVAGSLHKSWKLKTMNIGNAGGGRPPIAFQARVAMASDALPVEAGESQISVTVSGQIELE
ncbi:MAG: SIMPL domain-containing protein [Rhodocyclaceae bacterium]|nr:SIMPL domain-containing protein [Rhodocyclaceae bacterium]